jgi:hypothetical protein
LVGTAARCKTTVLLHAVRRELLLKGCPKYVLGESRWVKMA